MAVDAEQIDAVLPQTQCGLCGYGGCMPYARAMAQEQAAINLCPPGGVSGLLTLAEMLGQDPGPFLADMETKPTLVAVIREDQCIGCTKCIQACPVDAILGASKLMHTIVSVECTGCELCIAPCPVDCIDLLPEASRSAAEKKARADLARRRFNARQARLAPKEAPRNQKQKKVFIQEAILRAQAKKASPSDVSG